MQELPKSLIAIVEAQDGLFTRRQWRDAGLTDDALKHRMRVTGGAARVLPTVYAAAPGNLTFRQRLRAALLYGRIGGRIDVAIIGGLAACALHGVTAAGEPSSVELLLPMRRRLADHDFVFVRRTSRMGPAWRREGMPVCSPARAVVDAGRRMRSLDSARAITAEAVQRNKVSVEQLAIELAAGESAGSGLPRRVLAEVGDGVHSVAEAQFRQLVLDAGLPPPVWNRDIRDAQGKFIARPDAYWAEAGLIAEVQSREWHLSPEDWAATMRRSNRLSRLGFDVQQIPPSRIARQPGEVASEMRAAYEAGIARMARRDFNVIDGTL